jgi:hypothetical protein
MLLVAKPFKESSQGRLYLILSIVQALNCFAMFPYVFKWGTPSARALVGELLEVMNLGVAMLYVVFKMTRKVYSWRRSLKVIWRQTFTKEESTQRLRRDSSDRSPTSLEMFVIQ